MALPPILIFLIFAYPFSFTLAESMINSSPGASSEEGLFNHAADNGQIAGEVIIDVLNVLTSPETYITSNSYQNADPSQTDIDQRNDDLNARLGESLNGGTVSETTVEDMNIPESTSSIL